LGHRRDICLFRTAGGCLSGFDFQILTRLSEMHGDLVGSMLSWLGSVRGLTWSIGGWLGMWVELIGWLYLEFRWWINVFIILNILDLGDRLMSLSS
jgi:hypothetical protein